MCLEDIEVEKILPLVIVCIVGICICLLFLGIFAWKSAKKHFSIRNRHEVFEMDEKTLTVKLDKKDLRK